MTNLNKPRLRMFESAPSQQHVTDDDKYLYKKPTSNIRVGIIGTGTIGQEHMRVASLLGRVTVHGIYDESEHSQGVAAENFKTYSQQPLVRYTTLETACMDPDTDALMICTPNFTHLNVLQTAIKSGKPIFVEKPMATTLADAATILSIANNYSSFIQIGLQYRYKAQYSEAIYEVMSRKTLGDIKTISISEFRPPFLDKVNQWNKFNEFSGGTLVEKCCHYFDLINLLSESKPARVYASGGQAVNFKDLEKDGKKSDIDDHAFVTIDYENGIRASFTLNMFCPDFCEELIVTGPQGRLVASEKANFQELQAPTTKLSIELGEQGASRSTNLSYPRLIEQSGHNGSTFYEHIAFANQIEGIPADCATPIEGLWSIIVASAAQESLQSGQAVQISDFIQKHKLTEILAEQ